MKIRNYDNLAVTEARQHALQIAEAGLDAIVTENIIKKSVRLEGGTLHIKDKTYPLAEINRLRVVGIGKCALDAGAALERILGSKIDSGIILDVRGGSLDRLTVRQGDHPMPSERNVNATREIIQFLQDSKESDLVLFVVSGGGSTLLCQPRDFAFPAEAKLLHILFEKGATIHEINILRKHLSLARGGYLAQYAYPARAAALIFSDVPGDDINIISSGPTVPDETTVEDAKAILDKYGIPDDSGISASKLIETPKNKEFFERMDNLLIASNQDALQAMAEKAKELGLSPRIMATHFMGDAEEVGRKMVEEARKEPSHSALLWGGESTVRIRGSGKGGRNQTLALASLPELQLNQLVLALASDGRDNTDFAGALCDTITMRKAEKFGLDPDKFLKNNDTFSFFNEVGDYLLTGNTGSNVSDLVIVINE